MALAAVSSKVVVLFLLIYCYYMIDAPIVVLCVCSMFCWTLLYVLSSSVIILMGKRELVSVPCLSSWYLVTAIDLWLFLM